jgi:class 3 adenylate cyclase
MHRALREALTDAVGRSEFVIVVVADIRGFSSFSKEHESPDTAMYIKRVYSKLIDKYFSGASFYKPTGDGLLVTIPYNEKNLEEVANTTIKSCLSCLQEFANICADDNMINFSVPKLIGFGVARGTACCLHSGDKILDYSGHLLNLASRLMNLARPSGIVIDSAFKIELLAEDVRANFDEAKVYVRSLAENEPMTIYITRGLTEIPFEAHNPPNLDRWEEYTKEEKHSLWPKFGPNFRLDLNEPLKRPDAVDVRIIFPTYDRKKLQKDVSTVIYFKDWTYLTSGGVPHLRIDIDKMLKIERIAQLPSKSKITLRVRYVPSSSGVKSK